MNRRLLFIVVIFLFTCKITAQPPVPVGDFTLTALLDSIKIEMEKSHIPGLMLTIVSRDSVLYDGGLGLANIADNRPVDNTTLFRLGSISKSFAALCILKLESEGKFSLEDPLKKVAPDVPFENRWEDTHPVRIVHLLEHSAGFDDMHFTAVLNREGKEVSPLEMVKRHAKSLKTRWQPGLRHAYSNPGYVILTHIIEKYSGMSYQDYVRQTIFEPLGMQYSNFVSFPENADPYAQGYVWKDENYELVPFYPVYAGMAGALNTCGADMAKFLQFMMNRGAVDTLQILPSELIQKMETPTSTLAARSGLRTVYALANRPTFFNKPMTFRGHSGGINGFVSDYAYNRRYGFAISINSESSFNKIEDLIIQYLSQGLSLVKPKKEPIPDTIVQTFSGYFEMKSPRNQLFYFMEQFTGNEKMSFRGDTLLRRGFLSEPTKYLHMGENQFRTLESSAPQIVLTHDEAGTPVIVGNTYYEKSSAFAVRGRQIMFFGSLIVIASFLLFGLVWLILRIFGKVKPTATQITFTLWLGNAGLLVAFISAVILLQDYIHAGAFNAKTLIVFIGTVLFGVTAVLGLVQLFSFLRKPAGIVLKSYLTLVCIAMIALAVFLFQHGWIGLQLWSY